MDADFVLYLGRRTLEMALLISAPILVVILVVGLGVAMLQAVTSIRDMTLGLVLKIASVAVMLLLAGGWMLQVAVDFTGEVFNHMQAMGR